MNVIKTYLNGFPHKDERAEKLRFLLVSALVFSLPFDIFYSSILFITLVVATLIDLSYLKIKSIPKQAWLFQVVFFLGVAGYFYSYHKSVAGFLLERQLAILLLPLILPLAVKINKDKMKSLLTTLTVSCVVAILYLFADMVHNIVYNLKLPLFKTMFSGAFFNHQFSRPIGIHAGYLSLYVSLSVFYMVQVFNNVSSFRIKINAVAVMLILFMGLFFLASRNAIIATFFVLLFISPLFNSKNKLRYLIVSLSCLAICLLSIKNIPYLRERFSVQLVSDIRPLKNGSFYDYASAEPRMERWKGALHLIKKSPLIGYGTGDEIEMLKTEYIERELFISYLESFNAHNQYLSYLIKNGLLGLLCFLFAFYFYGRLAIRSRDFMYLSFLALLLIGFYTENILDANKGIVFFALFNTFFGYSNLVPEQERSVNL